MLPWYQTPNAGGGRPHTVFTIRILVLLILGRVKCSLIYVFFVYGYGIQLDLQTSSIGHAIPHGSHQMFQINQNSTYGNDCMCEEISYMASYCPYGQWFEMTPVNDKMVVVIQLENLEQLPVFSWMRVGEIAGVNSWQYKGSVPVVRL